MTIPSIIPDPETLLALEPEELAGVILEYLNSTSATSSDFNRYNFTLASMGEPGNAKWTFYEGNIDLPQSSVAKIHRNHTALHTTLLS